MTTDDNGKNTEESTRENEQEFQADSKRSSESHEMEHNEFLTGKEEQLKQNRKNTNDSKSKPPGKRPPHQPQQRDKDDESKTEDEEEETRRRKEGARMEN